jgi:hypothetical protein
MLVLQYVLIAYLVAIGFFTPVLLVVFLALPKLLPTLRILRDPRPATKPADYPPNVWPGWFVAYAFLHNRRWGSLFLLGLVGDLVARARSGASELEQLLARRPLDAARRVAGLGADLSIADYDELTAAEIIARLDEMPERDLRRVREYERANANRKTVLGAVERMLA